jgi:uncharacterized protein YndB with AHSA1/START domain
VNTDCVTVSTVVAVDPATAFDVFAEDIAGWWRPKVRGLFQSGQTGTLQFREGRLWEIYTDGEPFEIGRVLAWEPPTRLVVEWRQEGFAPEERTEVEVRFEAAPRGTRVTVEHRGWDALAVSHPGRQYTGGAFSTMIGLRWADALTALRGAAAICK